MPNKQEIIEFQLNKTLEYEGKWNFNRNGKADEFTRQDLQEMLSQSLDQYGEQLLDEYKGVSNWRKKGIESGYWAYFKEEVLNEYKKKITEKLNSNYGEDGKPAIVILEGRDDGGITQRPALEDILKLLNG